MRSTVLVVGILTACRFHFDERSDGGGPADGNGDALAAHDEDGDGIVDGDDVCPHAVNLAQADSDGDRVGDDCDPQPTIPNQSLAFFDPMLNGNNFTILTATWTELGDALGCNGTPVFCEIVRPLPFQYGTITLGIDIKARNPSVAQYQLAAAVFDDRATPYHYAEVWEAAPPGYAAVSRFDGTTYAAVMSSPLSGGVALGRLRLAFAAEPSRLVAGASWPNDPNTVIAQDASYTGGSILSIGGQGIVFELAYVAVVATN